MKLVYFPSMILLVFVLITSIPKARSQMRFLGYYCTNTSTFDPKSTYNSSINTLLRSFSSNATSNSDGYYATSVGNNSQNTVHGYYLCRGDLDRASCHTCMSTAVTNLPTTTATDYCLASKRATLYYDKCMFRYSNEILSGQMSIDVQHYEQSDGDITGYSNFEGLIAKTMKELATKAANDNELGKKYATKAMYINALTPLFALAQCTPDLNVDDCRGCLITGIGKFKGNKEGENFLTPSCNIRYEIYPFFNGAVELLGASPPMDNTAMSNNGKRNISIGAIVGIIAATAIVATVLTTIVMCFIMKRKVEKQRTILMQHGDEDLTLESLQYDLTLLQSATNNFSNENKLGEGGFGIVYKGKLLNGQDIAVKRFSRRTDQGEAEFKSEVLLVAKLQHRNLVRLLGYCLTEEEKLLIYEFVNNKSLDKFLFDPEMSKQLSWKRRYNIIEGIARGMLYLHEDSRLKIIHRDLKASNILLDTYMNPKVSDFGTARIFGVDQTKGNTKRVVGTFGYMAPEYVLYGRFSTKSDVYSFGILVLEIISGEKNYDFSEEYDESNLLSFAWKHWRDGTPLEFVDACIREQSSSEEVTRCMQIGLLCVHQDANERPLMSTIVLMLSSLSASMPLPKEPNNTTNSAVTSENNHSSTDSLLRFSIVEDDSVSLSMPR
ncbi:Cysteine-rich receptor-like protein kinase 25 [Bienertia sinuspersici]